MATSRWLETQLNLGCPKQKTCGVTPALSPLPWVVGTLGAPTGPISYLRQSGEEAAGGRRALGRGPAAASMTCSQHPPTPSSKEQTTDTTYEDRD